MSEIISFGEWVQKRRNLLHYSRNEFANLVGCAPITIKKIERDERKPSVEMAELIGLHLKIPKSERHLFVRRARGEYVPHFPDPEKVSHDDESSSTQIGTGNLDRQKVLGRLTPLPDQKLFGVTEKIDSVSNLVTRNNRPWIIALDGIGGIGKTTLAHTIVNKLIDTNEFDDYGWVSAKQVEFSGRGIRSVYNEIPALDGESLVSSLLAQLATGPYPTNDSRAQRIALNEILQQQRCLIVIDNLETVVDHEALLPLIRQLSNPSKFLLTSRVSLSHEGDVASESLSELSWGSARELLIHEAKAQGIAQLQNASEKELREIYQTAGGNPLALKMVIGQTRFLPINQVLSALRLAQTKQSDQLYHYIYWEAWEMLNENARQLLVSLPIVPNTTFDKLIVSSQLDPFEVQTALAELIDLSLVEIGPGDTGPRYKLHRLTETFLLHEVIKWQASATSQNQEKSFFKNQIGAVVDHWQKDKAITEDDVDALDQEKDGILKAIHLSLSIPESWVASKSLILALTRYMERRGHWQEWQNTLETAVNMARLVGDEAGEIRMLGLLGRILIRQNKTVEVIQNYRHVIRLARKTGDRLEEARACSNLGFTLLEKEQYWRAEILECHAIEIFTELNYQHGLAHTNNHLGLLKIRTMDWQEAEDYLQVACGIWRELEDLSGLQRGLGNLSILYNDLGLPKKAIETLEQQLAISNQIGDQTAVALAYHYLAVAHTSLSSYEEALAFATTAESLFKLQNDLQNLFSAWELIGKIKINLADFEAAGNYLESALDGFISLDFKEAAARVDSHFLRLYLAQEEWETAITKANTLKALSIENENIRKNTTVMAALADFETANHNRLNS